MFYDGWALFGALVIIFGQSYISEEVSRKQLGGIYALILSITVVASAYILFCGLHLASGWAAQVSAVDWQKTGQQVHNPKGWVVVAIIYVWPYFLIVAGALSALASLRQIARRRVRPLKRS